MKAVLTGDIIKSQNFETEIWHSTLKNALANTPANRWEIYRGDEFQVLVDHPEEAFLKAIQIKARIKKVQDLDVRIAIGFGIQDFEGEKLSESGGSAFVNSGRKLDTLKTDKINLGINTDCKDFDESLNLIFSWMSTVTDNWSVVSAEIMDVFLQNPGINQEEAARELKITQSSVSQRLKRAGYDLIMDTDEYFRKKTTSL